MESAQLSDADESTGAKTSASVANTGSASDQNAEGTTGDPNAYLGKINAWLKQFHRYPLASKKRKEEGVVHLKFTINREGEIQDASIEKSSGYDRLDRAALELLSEASPVPRIPDFMNRETLKLVIPIEYSLITNSN
ncbi:energy transducer TonB [Granulosicoccus antarcticus]|uniref:energy transducer TonB n=1 Tax=Granulosicoccus antarcticus TaxID=437505 RepID=UPI001F3EB4B5|nr:energy transducer TonB [Granulosicoccus antarcticus]